MTPKATMHPTMKIIFAPRIIAFLLLRFPIKIKEPAETGIPKAMNIIFQPQTPQLGPKQKVRPIVTKINPNNREIPAPARKLPSDSEFCPSSFLSIIYNLPSKAWSVLSFPLQMITLCIIFALSISMV